MVFKAVVKGNIVPLVLADCFRADIEVTIPDSQKLITEGNVEITCRNSDQRKEFGEIVRKHNI